VLSDRALRELAALHRAERAHRLAWGREASPDELAGDCGLQREHVLQLQAVERVPESLANAASDDDAFERVEERLASAQLCSLPGELGEREREVLRARFGLGQPSSTLHEIAVTLGISGERVRQIEARALERLREVALAQPALASTAAAPRRSGTSRATPARSDAPVRH
jgi:DNA-directed RNA polymerase sigma subunit (sigma70/sigma32)